MDFQTRNAEKVGKGSGFEPLGIDDLLVNHREPLVLDRMIFRLFALPALLIAGGFLTTALSVYVRGRAETAMTLAVANALFSLLGWLTIGMLVGGLLIGAFQAYRLWRWWGGRSDEPVCWNCGGLVAEMSGRWGPYCHCLACGTNRKAH